MTAYIEVREVDMNADVNTIMTLMSMLNKTPSAEGGKNPLQTMLPLLMGMMSGGRGGQSAGTTSQGAGASAAGAGQNNLMTMLPMLMNMMRAGTPPAGDGGARECDDGNCRPNRRDAADAGGAYGNYAGGREDAYADSRARTNGADRGDYLRPDAFRTERRDTAPRAPVSPFTEIGFAGAEVRGFMETLWRIRRRI